MTDQPHTIPGCSQALPDGSSDTLEAPAGWQVVDFISDLHLQASEPATALAWEQYLQGVFCAKADALFILGDLFEVWIGDDLPGSPRNGLPADTAREADFLGHCTDLLWQFSRHTPVYFLHGNRDFLLGPAALARMGMQALPDPTTLSFQGERYLISHGDALCLADTEYQRFRALVRTQEWQASFLQQPLMERAQQAAVMRQHSQARKQHTAHDPSLWADVDKGAALACLREAGARTLIHGHTHRPAVHDLSPSLQRVVLSDWDLNATHPRAEVLRLQNHGWQRLALV